MAAIIYKCPNCGGDLVFDPSSRKYKCEYCQSVFSRQEMDAFTSGDGKEEQAWEENVSGEAGQGMDADAFGPGTSGQEQAVYYSCPSCGAQIITDETTAATYCYYCHNPVVLAGRLSGKYLPDYVLPFRIDREKAVETFREKIGRKKFVPKAFWNDEQIEKLTGIYYPYWVYGCAMDASMEGTGTRVRVYRTGDTEVTETSIYGIERAGKVTLDKITRNALQKTDRQLVENVQPFSLDEMQKFSMTYLSGFQAEKRDMEKETFADEIHTAVQGYAQNILRDTISGYSTFTPAHKEFRTEQENWKYVLLPVWVLTYAGLGGKIYYFAMNGQNGNVYGSFPLDWKKLSLVSLLIFAVVTVLCLAGGYML